MQPRYKYFLPERIVEKTEHFAQVTIVGKDFDKEHNVDQYNMSYVVGDHVWFDPAIRPEVASLNIQAVLDEVPLLIAWGAQTVRGLGGPDRWENPLATYLCYHRDPDDYRKDILSVKEVDDLPPISKEDLISVAQACDDIEYVATEDQPIIYSKGFVGANLYHFYKRLLTFITGKGLEDIPSGELIDRSFKHRTLAVPGTERTRLRGLRPSVLPDATLYEV